MNSRERFIETMRLGKPDRVPYFEEGLRDDVLKQWRKQGLAKGADLQETFGTDRREEIPLNLGPIPKLTKPVSTRRDLAKLKERLDPARAKRLPKGWHRKVKGWRGREHVLSMAAHHGFFLTMGVGDWARFRDVMYLMHDEPKLVRDILVAYAECSAAVMERVLAEVEVDFVSFSEPIGGSDGPLLHPELYRRFILPGYKRIIKTVRRHGVENIVFITYANARILVPCILEAGFNCLWACEVENEVMDYRALRRKFGRKLRLIGGLDLDALLAGKAAIRRELKEKLPPLLKQGGYVPLADGRVRANVPLENYRYYRRLLAKMTGG